MAMPHYPVLCTNRDCRQIAEFKLAARWSDGITHELKTYALTCSSCLVAALADAAQRRASCRLAPGETLEPPGVYELARGQHDYQLQRRLDLEGA